MVKNTQCTKDIHRILRRTVVTPDMYHDWLNNNGTSLERELKLLDDYLISHAPSRLYKMRPVKKRAIEAVEKELLFLTRADYFNDPYDCALFYDVDRIKRNIREYTSEQNMRMWLKRSGVTFPLGDKFKDIEEYLEYIEGEKEAFLSTILEDLPQVEDKLQNNTFVASLTEKITSPVMWAHYADEHKGFAIEYQFEKTEFSPHPFYVPDVDYHWYGWRSILPVFYSQERADGTELAEWYAFCELQKQLGKSTKYEDYSIFLHDLLLKSKLCLQKAEEWCAEREWRLMIVHNWPNQINEDFKVSVPAKVAAIYLGSRMKEEDCKKLVTIAEKKGIPVYKMSMDPLISDYKMCWNRFEGSENKVQTSI